MTLRLALCFLFHQPLCEHADRATRIGYRGVLDVLGSHPRLKINLMLSGPLIEALAWFDPAFLETVKSGLQAGRFRLLGSTYAQCLLPAGDDADNVRQIAVHRAALKKYFEAEPAAFWPPHGAFAARHAGMLVDAGYRTLALEDGALRAAGTDAPRVGRIAAGGGQLNAAWSDARLRDCLDFAAWFRRRGVLEEALDLWRKHPDADRLFPVCAEDAAAFGLWGYDFGLDPRADAAGLDELLDWLERADGIEFAFLEDAPEGEEPIELKGPVWSRLMDRALADPDFPLHEEGYADWGDFQNRAPRLKHFRMMHTAARLRMAASEAALAVSEESAAATAPGPGRGLMALAERVYCAHQDRFGAVGVGGRGDPAWEGIGAAIAVAKAAELAASAPSAPFEAHIDDLTGDGEDEVLLRKGDRLALLSPYGGRLLKWADLARGQLLVGNPLAVPTGTILIEAKPPEFAPMPDDWLPQEGDPLPEMQAEGGERRLPRLERQNLPLITGPLPVWPRLRSAELRPSLPARRRALNDYFSLDDGPEEKADPRMDFRLAEGAVVFLRFFGYRLRLLKRVSLTASGVRAVYRFRNVDMRAVRVRLRIVSEVCPDYQAALDFPGRAYEAAAVGPRRSPAVKNLRTGRVIVSHVSRPDSAPPVCRPGILAWEIEQTVDFAVEPGATEAVVVRLNLLPV